MFGGKKAKELEEELLALQEKQNRLQEQISNIAKAKDSAEETLVQMTISKTELDETITAVSEELELLKECSEANSGQTVLLKQQLAKKNEQNIRLQQEKEALCQQMEGEHEKIAKVVEKNKNRSMRHIVRRESLLKRRYRNWQIFHRIWEFWHSAQQSRQDAWEKTEENL